MALDNPVSAAGAILVQLKRQPLVSEEGAKTILWGPCFSNATAVDGTRVTIVGSGSEMEIQVELPGEEETRAYRVDLRPIAGLAVDLARAEIA